MDETISIRQGIVRFPVREGLLRGPDRFVHALDDVSLTLHGNETVALVGESGSGKSTLGMSMIALNALTSGTIAWRGKDISRFSRSELLAFRRDVQIVFQDPFASLNPRLTIGETLMRPLRRHRTVPRADMRARVEEMLDRVGLRPGRLYIDRYPHEFSGGQRQRVAIARALILNPTVIVADEPVSALDVSIQAQILDLLAELKRDLGLSMLFLSHDLGVVRFISDRVAVMFLGRIVELGAVAEVFERPKHPYTKLLLDCAPTMRRRGGDGETTPELAGEPADPTDPPSGCRFRTRCPFAFDRCAMEAPALRPLADGHLAACHLNEPTVTTPAARGHAAERQ